MKAQTQMFFYKIILVNIKVPALFMTIYMYKTEKTFLFYITGGEEIILYLIILNSQILYLICSISISTFL